MQTRTVSFETHSSRKAALSKAKTSSSSDALKKNAHAVLAAVHVVDGPDAAALVDRHHLAFVVAASSFGATDGCELSAAHRAQVLVFCDKVAVPLQKPRRCIVALAINRGG